MSNPTFTIGDVAVLLDISVKTIRHYHTIGLLDQPERDANNYRLYSIAHIQQLQQIMRLKHFGLSLKQIEIVIHADNPDELIQLILNQHTYHIRDEIARLQHQLDVTEHFLKNQASLSSPVFPTSKPPVSALNTLADALKPHHNGVSDLLVEVERDAMAKLDQFTWDANYELFWHLLGKQFVQQLHDEGIFIVWMERYLALASMNPDDLQGNTWLQELHYSRVRHNLIQAFAPPLLAEFPATYQHHIRKLVLSLLYQGGSELQKHFFAILTQP
jgi:DNA-binding transcriptional MerR regulator